MYPRRAPRPSAILLATGLAVSFLAASGAAQPGVPARSSIKEGQAGAADELPIKRITLYRSGVGYFERDGGVTGDAKVQLRFKTEQINDILKSMVLLDLDGGRIDAVSYGSKEPLERRLASFGVNIANNPSVGDLLNQLRGAPIKIVAGGQQITGTILGIESRKVPTGKEAGTYDAPHLNLVTASGLKSIAIADVTSFEITDKELAEELNKVLAALAEYRADRSKTVDLNFSGKGTTGQRRVVVGYVHEMPVWKTSYRLILPDESAPKPGTSEEGAKKKGPSTLNLKGWAIVENNTDQDWNDVRLSLVSGRPVSFQMDLYEPLFVSRPMVAVPVIAGVAPRAYAAGVEGSLGERLRGEVEAAKDLEKNADKRVYARRAAPATPAAPAKPGAPADAAGFKQRFDTAGDIAFSADDMANYSAAAQAQAGEIGEVFQYELEAPVTIERQRSAMIPFLSAPVSGRRVSIYSAADGSKYPMRGVELTNDSKLQLLPGPISVFDGSDNRTAYAGDATIGHIAPTDKRLLAYAIDLDVNVLTTAASDSTVTHLKIVDGTFEQTVKTQNRMSYAFDNKDSKRSRTIIIEHPKLEGWTLIRPEKPLEEAQSIYRFELPVASGKKETLSVVQERVESQRTGITTIDLPTILSYRKDGKVSDKVVDTMKEVGRRQAAIAEAQKRAQEIDKQVAEISTDQARIRQNMAGIDKSSQLYNRYMAKLTDQETKLEDLTDRKDKAQQEIARLQAEFNEYLRTLNVE